MNDFLREMLKPKKAAKNKPALDGCGEDKDKEMPVLDGAVDYTTADISLKSVAAVQQWVETDDLDEGETLVDRLMNMFVGIADANKDGEISEDEQGVVDIALNEAWGYLEQYGVAEDDISALLNDWDNDAAERIRDLLAASLPEGEAADADIDGFVFGSGDQEPALDAVYKKTMAVRDGKKVRINKRISGTVRLSAKQKIAIRKAGMKSHSAMAMMHRAKSMKVRKRTGL